MCYVASLIYPELRKLSFDDIKALHGDKRQRAKFAGFAINYGGSGGTIAASQGISKEEGDAIYKSYLAAFPGLDRYFKNSVEFVLNNGYILVNNITGRKLWSYQMITAKRITDMMLRKSPNGTLKSFWKEYYATKEVSGWGPYLQQREAAISSFRNISFNIPIQGTGADMVKTAASNFFDWIVENGLFGIVLIPNLIHDEFLVEGPYEMRHELKKVVSEFMEEASKIFCEHFYVRADPHFDICWTKKPSIEQI